MKSDTQPRKATRGAVKPPANDRDGAPNDARLRLLAIGWFCLASVAGLYLTSVWMFGPIQLESTADKRTSRIASASPASLNIARPSVRQADEGDERKLVTLADLTKEMKSLQGKVAQLRNRNAALTREVNALSDALLSATGSIPTETLTKPRPILNGVTTTKLPMPIDGFGDLAFASRSPVPIASKSVASRTLFAVELSRAKSVDSLRQDWNRLGARHGTLFKGLKAHRVGSDDSEWRLVAGPFANAADAAVLCARLRAAQTKCSQTTFGGDAL